FGLGFNPNGGNTVQASARDRAAGPASTPNPAMPRHFDASGSATLRDRSPNSGTHSAPVSLSVGKAAGCPQAIGKAEEAMKNHVGIWVIAPGAALSSPAQSLSETVAGR
ncbi:MAG TPA: hypothetical protein VGS58_11445, partial [Candidatus Sulfopaludibacter sp.]|nr:hypothetical protein [Candidatus Sulfopaludibacter sp.]